MQIYKCLDEYFYTRNVFEILVIKCENEIIKKSNNAFVKKVTYEMDYYFFTLFY